MNNSFLHRRCIVVVPGIALAITLAGCAVYPGAYEAPGIHSPPGYAPAVEATVFLDRDSYDYYPEQDLYYSRTRQHYIYLDNGVWTSRRDPGRYSHDVIRRARFVPMDYHDAPSLHHAEVQRRYRRSAYVQPHQHAPQRPQTSRSGRSSHE